MHLLPALKLVHVRTRLCLYVRGDSSIKEPGNMIMQRVLKGCVFALLCGIVVPLQVKAEHIQLNPNDSNDSVLLSDLINGDVVGVTVGDKIFDGFSYTSIGDVPSAGNVNVLGIMIDGNYGLRFQGGFKDLFDDENESSDALIGFDVAVANPEEYLISDVHLAGNPSLSLQGASQNAFAEVVETVFGDFGSVQLRIQEDLNGLIGTAWVDPLPWPVEKLRITKDIQLLSIEGVRASLSFVDQTFSQVSVVVPEPTSMGLILLMGMGISCTRYHRRLRL